MSTVKFLLQSSKNPATIYVRVRHNRKDLKVATTFVIDPENWSTKKGWIKSSKTPDQKRLNVALNSLQADLTNQLNHVENPTSEWLKSLLNRGDEPKTNPDDFLDVCESFLESKRESRLRTIQAYEYFKGVLADFQEKVNKRYSTFEVDLDFLDKLILFLKNERNLRDTTIHKRISYLKTIMKYARKKGHKTHPQLDYFEYKAGKVHFVYLRPHEIEAIEKLELKEDYLDNARNWLVLSCFLGQRGGDLLRLRSSQVLEIDGRKYIDLTQEKGDKQVYVYILPKAQDILNKLGGEFPRAISTQKYNDYIKEVCRLAGLDEVVFGAKINPKTKRKEEGNYEKWQLVTSHIGRRSFATNYYGKIDTPLLMAQTGHTTEKIFLKYIGKSRNDQVRALANALETLTIY